MQRYVPPTNCQRKWLVMSLVRWGPLTKACGQKHAARKADRARKRYKGLDEAPRYVTPAFSYNYQRDHSFETEQRVSTLTLAGRVIVPYTGNNLHVGLIQHGAQIGAAKL